MLKTLSSASIESVHAHGHLIFYMIVYSLLLMNFLYKYGVYISAERTCAE